MRGELNRLRGVEEEARKKTNQVTSLLEELERLRKELSATQQEKKTIEDWAQTYRNEMEMVRRGSRFISVHLPVVHLPVHSVCTVVTCPSVCLLFYSMCVYLFFPFIACRLEIFP